MISSQQGPIEKQASKSMQDVSLIIVEFEVNVDGMYKDVLRMGMLLD